MSDFNRGLAGPAAMPADTSLDMGLRSFMLGTSTTRWRSRPGAHPAALAWLTRLLGAGGPAMCCSGSMPRKPGVLRGLVYGGRCSAWWPIAAAGHPPCCRSSRSRSSAAAPARLRRLLYWLTIVALVRRSLAGTCWSDRSTAGQSIFLDLPGHRRRLRRAEPGGLHHQARPDRLRQLPDHGPLRPASSAIAGNMFFHSGMLLLRDQA